MKTLTGSSVLLTGATAGIGKSLAIKLLDEGVNLSFCGRTQKKMSDLLHLIEAIPENQYYHDLFDLADLEHIKRFVAESISRFNGVDYLINCAGLNTAKAPVSEIELSDLDYMHTINVKAPLVFMKEVYQDMIKKQNGVIINILSSVCLFSNESAGSYTASKAAIEALTKIFRKEVRKDNIRVCAVYPGGVDTDFRPHTREDYLKPDSVADAIISLMKMDDDVAMHELVLRPMVEGNF